MELSASPRGEPPNPPHRAVFWSQAWRVVAARYPPIDLFERLSPDPGVWEVLIELEQATNPRVRDELGEISLVPASRCVHGPGASWVMAAFTHLNRAGSRFSDGSYGVYYCARERDTAIAETAYHFARLARAAADPPRREDMRVLRGSLRAPLADVDALGAAERAAVLHPRDYRHGQALGRSIRDCGGEGVVFASVRSPGGMCAGLFWPNVPAIPSFHGYLQYEWDGERVRRVFDYATDAWRPLPDGLGPAEPEPSRAPPGREAPAIGTPALQAEGP